MKFHLTLTATVMAFFFHITVCAQGIGSWRAYMAYHTITDVQQGGQMLYVLASNNLYTYNQKDRSIQTFDKVNVLSDCDIAFIRWNPTVKKLLVVYSNQNIDLLDANNGNIINLSDLYSKNMTGDKTVNSIYVYNQFAYLATNFGIVKIDMSREEFSDTYNLGFPVNFTYVEGGFIFASSKEKGTYRASLTSNLLDNSVWSRMGGFTDKSETPDADLLAIAKSLNPGGPNYNYFGYMTFKNHRLYTCGGGWGYSDLFRKGCVQILTDGEWQTCEEDIAQKTSYPYLDLDCLAIDPTDPNHLFAAGRTGIYEFKEGIFQQAYNIDNTNGILQVAQTVADKTAKHYVIVNALTFNQEGTLWGLNSISPSSSLFCFTKEESWESHHKAELMYDSNKSLENMVGLTEDSQNLLWFCNNHWRTPSLFCYQPSTNALASFKNFVNQDGTAVDISYVRCIAEDKDHNIWVGTNVGPLLLERSEINAESPVFTQVKVPRNDGTDYADYLLSGIDITAVAIDAGGRKWLGTNNNGVYLISEDCYTQVHHFLSTNSPLLSNNIESIAINDETGEVFFGTDKGLCSYMSDATAPNETMTKDNVWAYPNPVKPDYTGLITVTGLAYDADVKIVSVNGTLVNQGRSNGGTYTWNGNDLKGKRVASGVYMVETATSQGEKGTVCKIAIVR